MRTELKYTDDYTLLVDMDYYSEEPLKSGQSHHSGLKIIAYEKLNLQAPDLDLPLLSEFEDWSDRVKFVYLVQNIKGGEKGDLVFDVVRFEDLEEAKQFCDNKEHLTIEQEELVQSKVTFTVEDVRQAICLARGIKDRDSSFDIDSVSGLTEICTYDWEEEFTDDEIIRQIQQGVRNR